MDFYTYSDFGKNRIEMLQAEARQRDLVRRVEHASQRWALAARSVGGEQWSASLRRSAIAFATILLSVVR